MEKINEKPSLYQAMREAHDERAAFFYIDLLAGSAGLWIPVIFVGGLIHGTSVGEELTKLFESSGVYIFSIAFVAASSSFIYLERRKNILNEVRESYSRNAGFHAMVVIALGMLLVGIQYSNTNKVTNEKVIVAVNAGTPDKVEPTMTTPAAQPQLPAGKAQEQPASSASWEQDIKYALQVLYFVLSLWLGIRLFCLRNIQKIPGEFDRIKQKEEEASMKLLDAARSNNSF